MSKFLMGFFKKEVVEDKPLAHHAGVVSTLIGLSMRHSIFEQDQSRFGESFASVLDLYVGTLNAPALPNYFAIGSGREFAPCWDKEFVRAVVADHADEFGKLKEAFVDYAKGTIQQLSLTREIIACLGYPADVKQMPQYDEGLLTLSLEVLANLAEKYSNNVHNGRVGQEGNDSYIQGVTASVLLGVLLTCEKKKR